jgi:tetratricopeptide (TPR) repeat protein
MARNSTFVYKGKAVNIQQVGRELGVKYVLEGSVRRAGDQLRINAQLVDATTGQHLWAERYDGSMKDVFSLQDKINQKIVAALAVKLTAQEKATVDKKETTNLAAYEEFLKGREHYQKFTVEDLAKAMGFFKKAIELDPNYRRAKATLALFYYQIAARGPSMLNALNIDYFEARLRARQYLLTAMAEPTAITYMLSGYMNLTLRQWDEALSDYEKALALDPNDPIIHHGMSWALNMSGRPAEAMEHAKTGMRLDPLNPARYLAQIGLAHFCKGEWQSAVTASEQALKLNPNEMVSGAVLASAYAHLGRNEEAKAAYEAYRQWVGIDLPLYVYPFKDRRVEESFVEGLMKAGWSGASKASLHVSSQDQITGDDLRAFYYPSTIRGYSPFVSEWTQEFAGDGTVTFRAAGIPGGDYTGRSWLEGDKICIQFTNLFAGLPSFRATFRNPRGTPQGSDEYLVFSDTGPATFSKVK